MKRCGILTINVSLMNYGNRLQNYALQEVIKSLGFEVETVNYTPIYPAQTTVSPSPQLTFYQRIKRKLRGRKNMSIWQRLNNRYKYRRKICEYREFKNKRIMWSKERLTYGDDLRVLAAKYDYVICGSDQVWNPYWEGTQPIYFMEFIPQERRIAYAVSFGVSDIPENMKEMYRVAIESIPHLSCREARGVELIRSLTGKEAKQVLDPTLMLDRGQWENIEDRFSAVKSGEDYILAYFLGKMDEGAEEVMISFAQTNNCRTIYLDKWEYKDNAFASPTEFLYLVHHARLIVTDSFHGIVFSIIYNRPFVYVPRSLELGQAQDMSSRMDSLLRLFKLEGRAIDKLSAEDWEWLDYTEVNMIWQKEKESSMKFLRSALGV
ncbi:MAG: polysaccharide pyruvyl transferase family protein [Selenomonadaceae bacterium]|nr:polysaccharide pyruvyl transferase family protein [Selenomonadaceae bacterium]